MIVPVLSSRTSVSRRALSRASALRNRIPERAPRPVPARIAVGVARPSAHGHAMIRTDASATVASSARGSGPTTYHATQVTTPIDSTTGTKTPEIRSASFWIGGLDACASATSRAMCASAVSFPTAVASISRTPSPSIVPPITRSPSFFSTGMDSPVSMDSSTEERPDRTTPSTGTASPGLTRSRSPGTTSASGTSRSAPFSIRRAVRGARLSSRRTASDARAAGPRLEPPAEQEQREDDADRLVVHGRHSAVARRHGGRRDRCRHGGRRDGRRDGEQERGGRADGDERVHVRVATPQRAPCARQEGRAGPCVHRQREREQDPLAQREHDVGHREDDHRQR